MKKLFAILLVTVLVLTAAACGKTDSPPEETPPAAEPVEEEVSGEEVLAPGEDPSEQAPKVWQAGVVYGLTNGCPYTFPLERTEATQTELDRWNELIAEGQIDRFDARSMSEYNGVVTPENAQSIFDILRSANLALMEEIGNPNTGGSIELIALDLAGNKLIHCLYDQYWFTVQFGEENTAYVFDGSLVGWSRLEEQLTTIANIEELPWEEYLLHMAETKGLTESELRSLENMGYTRDELQSMPLEEIKTALYGWEQSAQPGEEVTAMFGIGPDGELKEIADGGKIGSWLIADLIVQDDNWVEATFLSNLELECTVTLDPMAQERAYLFSVVGEGVNQMPFYQEDDREGVWFQSATDEGLDCLSDLGPGEEISCRVTIYEYNYSFVPMAGYSTAHISKIEIIP